MFALRLLPTHGLQTQELHLVARATTVASILYATPAWWGFAGEGDRLRLEQLIPRMRRRAFPNIESLAEEVDCLIVQVNNSINATPISCDIYLLTSPPLRAPSVLGHIISSSPKDNRNFVSRVPCALVETANIIGKNAQSYWLSQRLTIGLLT